MSQHEPDPDVPACCKHCGGLMIGAGSDEYRCVERAGPPPPHRPIPPSGLDDTRTIWARMEQLRREREEASSAVEPPDPPVGNA